MRKSGKRTGKRKQKKEDGGRKSEIGRKTKKKREGQLKKQEV